MLIVNSQQQRTRATSVVDDGEETGPDESAMDPSSIAAFRKANPDFDPAAFQRKVAVSFNRIQSAWSAQNLSLARAFLSDGTYQRFATQFRMMQLLRQRNELSRIVILAIQPAAARVDGAYEVLDVAITARMHDAFVCELDHSLDEAGDGEFTEYWSFLRKRGASGAKGDVYEAQTCPSCAAPLPNDMGEVCHCKYCNALVNSGEFDWVLAEITQEADYETRGAIERLVTPGLEASVAQLRQAAPDFSTQLAEDKASNGFMQVMTAIATREPALVRRFVDDAAFAQVKELIGERHVVFDRIYTNEAVLIRADASGPRHRVTVGIAVTAQRVELHGPGSLHRLDAEPRRQDWVLVLERDAAGVPPKGALYQHQCSACGGQVSDSLDLACPYCSMPLNSTKHEWIVTAFLSAAEYLTPRRQA